LLRGTALTVDRGRRHAFRETRGEHRIARDVHALLARLVDAADDHVLDEFGIGAGALHEVGDDLAAEIDGMPVLQLAALAAARRAGRGDDIGFRHLHLSLVLVPSGPEGARGKSGSLLLICIYTFLFN